jgi:hypothetical protein
LGSASRWKRSPNPAGVPDGLLGETLGLIYDGLAARAGKLPS